ncbi:hypothetical protein ABEI17_08430 [Pantoea agglomerans]|uniref:hypothetical protein n=1 Tax=Enterobacter agglomerans TaxID=549 RepID=UPI0003B19372|nr:hypothetical protein [Pantoea agglomerans]ERM09042.1 hypothetical protein L584_02645 [Pantoea agglomerans Tx10]
MQFQIIPGFFIFLGSYLPLAFILALQDIPKTWWSKKLCTVQSFSDGSCVFIPFENPIISISFLLVTFIAILIVLVSLKKIKYPFEVEVKKYKKIPNEIINYTFPYIVSFMGISYGDPQKLIGFMVFLLWMFAITYKSGQILMNPLLIIMKWKIYEATIVISNVEKDVRILTQGDLGIRKVSAQTIQDFYIVKG